MYPLTLIGATLLLCQQSLANLFIPVNHQLEAPLTYMVVSDNSGLAIIKSGRLEQDPIRPWHRGVLPFAVLFYQENKT